MEDYITWRSTNYCVANFKSFMANLKTCWAESDVCFVKDPSERKINSIFAFDARSSVATCKVGGWIGACIDVNRGGEAGGGGEGAGNSN